MKSSQVNAGDLGRVGQYNNLRDDAYASSWLLAHEQNSPDLTLKVEEGKLYFGSTFIEYAGGNSASFTAPATNPRIDILSINSSGTLVRTAGTEAGSPIAPNVPAGNFPIAQIYNRVGQTSIKDTDDSTNGYIQKDLRPFLTKDFDTADLITKTLGENISNGDIVVYATGNAKKWEYVNTQANTYQIDSSTKYIAQTFTVPTGCTKIRQLGTIIRSVNSPSGTMTISLYPTSGGAPDTSGSPLASIYSGTPDVGNFNYLEKGDINFTVTPGTVYAIVIDCGSATLDGSNYVRAYYDNTNPYANGSFYTKAGAGSWTISSGNDMSFQIEYEYESNKVFKFDNNIKLNGDYILQCARTEVSGNIGLFRKIDNVLSGLSGLTSGTAYYTSDTAGGVATDATKGILLGNAISTTEIAVIKNKTREIFSVGSTSSSDLVVGTKIPEDGFVEISDIFFGGSPRSLTFYVCDEKISTLQANNGPAENYREIYTFSTSGTNGANPIQVKQGDMIYRYTNITAPSNYTIQFYRK